MRPIQDLTSASSSSSLRSISFTGTAVSCAVLMIGVFQNRQAAQNFSALQNLPADGADHVFQAQAIRVGVIALRAGEFAEADGHHLKQAALDLAGEIGVPFHAADQEHAVRES